MKKDEESSFQRGFGGTFGVLMALFIVFILLPCGMCGGLAVCGGVIAEMEQQQVREVAE